MFVGGQSLLHAYRPWSPPCLRQEDRIAKIKFKAMLSGVDACAVHVLDHFSRLLFAPLSGLLQCQAPRHRRHPSSPLFTKLFRRLLKFQSFRLTPAPLHAPTQSVSKRQGGKKTLKLPTLQILLCAVVTHSLLSVKVCLGLAIFCVL